MHPEDPESLADAIGRLQEKYRGISKKLGDLERDHAGLTEGRTDMEARIRVLETEESRMEAELSNIDKRLRGFELSHDKRKENWNMVVNFVIQLVWVAMAAFMLSKLGLQAPL